MERQHRTLLQNHGNYGINLIIETWLCSVYLHDFAYSVDVSISDSLLGIAFQSAFWWAWSPLCLKQRA
jgi:hypothetical protein